MIRTIVVSTDSRKEMAAVHLDGKLVMEGNYWDFHNGCHGIYEWGAFNSVSALVFAISNKLEKEGFNVKIKNTKYFYGEG